MNYRINSNKKEEIRVELIEAIGGGRSIRKYAEGTARKRKEASEFVFYERYAKKE
jgi:hypothetical protein